MSFRTIPFLALLALLVGALFPPAARSVDEKDLLPVDQAFALEAKAESRDRILLTWRIAPGYYLYRHRIHAEGLAGGTLALPPGPLTVSTNTRESCS